jgi:hypothetical protein
MGVYGRDGGTRQKSGAPAGAPLCISERSKDAAGPHQWAVQRPLTLWPATLQVTAPEALLDARFAVPV